MRVAAVPAPGRLRRELWRARRLALAGKAAEVTGWLAGRLLASQRLVPGVGGSASLTAGLAVVVHSVFRQVPALGVAAAVAGVFLLVLDKRIP